MEFRVLSDDLLSYAVEVQAGGRDGVEILLSWWARADHGRGPPTAFEAFRYSADGQWDNLVSLGDHTCCEAQLLRGAGAARCGDTALVFLTVEEDERGTSWATRLDGSRWFDAPIEPDAWRCWAGDALLRLHRLFDAPYL